MLNVSLFRFCQEKMLNNFVEKKDTFFTFLVQNWPFFHQFFLANIGQENVFHDILERKNAFQAIKTASSKSGKIAILSKGLTHGFGQKLAIFPPFL